MRPVIALPSLLPRHFRAVLVFSLIFPAISVYAAAQDASPAPEKAFAAPIVPQQIRFSGKLPGRAGDTVEATFRIYVAADGGDPLWTESQSLTFAEDGSYTVLLGSASPAGLPQTVFSAGVARWLGVSVDRGPESDRIPLASVPYAMKSADAGALSGHPASDFVTQQQLAAFATQPGAEPRAAATAAVTPLTSGTVTGQGTASTIPLWIGTNTQGNSEITQSGANIGINQSAPGSTLDVGGAVNVAGNFTLPPVAVATSSTGQRSQYIQLSSSEFSSTSKAAVTSNFKILSNVAVNDTASPSGRLEFHYQPSASGASLNVFSINGDGTLNFAPGQKFPGIVQSVTATSPVTAVTSAGAVTVGLNSSVLNSTYAQIGAANLFSTMQTMEGLTVNGLATATSVNADTVYNLGSYQFATGDFPSQNVYLGYALVPNSGEYKAGNVAIGVGSVGSLVSGSENTAVGGNTLASVTTGGLNTAVGFNSLIDELGSYNTAVGWNAGQTPSDQMVTSSSNTFLGYNTGLGTATPVNESVAIGANALVSASNAMALGGTGGDALTVGIGTATPFSDYALDVEATTNTSINGGIVVNAKGGNLYLGMTSGTHKFRVDQGGTVWGTGYNTGGADFAESVAVRGQRSSYEPGDLLVIDSTGNRRLALAKKPYSTLVAGIYSTRPGMLASPYGMDDQRPATTDVPLAVVGIVPCKVTAENGPIQTGDLLVTSSLPGHAMKGTNRRQMLGAVVGKALEPLAKGTGVIQVLVTLQ